MTPERYQQVKSAFALALSITPERRTSFLRQFCLNDPGLLEQVLALIAADQTTVTSLDRPAVGTEFRLRTTRLANTATRHPR